jgi:hypothetical protein
MSKLCTLPLNTQTGKKTDKNTTQAGGLPKEASIMPKPKVDSPKKKS